MEIQGVCKSLEDKNLHVDSTDFEWISRFDDQQNGFHEYSHRQSKNLPQAHFFLLFDVIQF